MKNSITAAVAGFATYAYAGGLVWYNGCEETLHLNDCPGSGDEIIMTKGPGEQYSRPWVSGTDWSLKMSATGDFQTKITQFEWNLEASTSKLWWDVSEVDGAPYAWQLISSNPSKCPAEAKAYQYSTDDLAMQEPCTADDTISMVVCPDTDTGKKLISSIGGGSSGSDTGSSGESSASSAAPSSSAASYDAPASSAPSSSAAAYTDIQSAPSSSAAAAYTPAADTASSATAAAAYSTPTPAADVADAVTVTDVQTAYSSAVETAYVRSGRGSHWRRHTGRKTHL